MQQQKFSTLPNLRYDLPASLVVFLVALPLCLGIALASGAPLFSGLIAGIVGGVVVGALSKSPLSVSGPAAGLAVIVLDAITTLPTYNVFLLAVLIAGILQIGLGFLRAGVIGDFIPSSVIKGMLSAIGLILIIKQVPYALGHLVEVGVDDHAKGQEGLFNMLDAFQHVSPAAIIISAISILFLIVWEKKQPTFKSFVRYIPGPLVVVVFGVIAAMLPQFGFGFMALETGHMVSVPVSDGLSGFFSNFSSPDFSAISSIDMWKIAITLAIVASIETLLSIEAVDNIDPYKRVTPTNRELVAQGAGNIVSGFIGGLPITSVIVRSSANITAGARTKTSAIAHGLLLLACVVLIPGLLNKIPLASLAAILIMVGYKLVKPSIFVQKYKKGYSHLIPYLATIIAILALDLLMGIAIGLVFGVIFVLIQNYHSAIMVVSDDKDVLIRCKKDLFFLHKFELKTALSAIPPGSSVMIDVSRIRFIDQDNIEIMQDFLVNAAHSNIAVSFKPNPEADLVPQIKGETNGTL